VYYRLPADLLNVLVGSHSQLFATAQSAALQDGAPVGCRHALAESVHAHTAADFRLVRTFRHSSFLTLKNTALGLECSIKYAICQFIGMTLYRKGFDSVN
jgi:hypothetical protein